MTDAKYFEWQDRISACKTDEDFTKLQDELQKLSKRDEDVITLINTVEQARALNEIRE